MTGPLSIHNSITINASVQKVWDALVNPAQTKKYMFGCEALSDWKVGSPLVWKGVFDGMELVAVKGKIVSIDRGRSLAYTVIDPNDPNMPDIPENYLTVTYTLSSDNEGRTILSVTQGDYSKVADGQRRYMESYNNGEGWNPILVKIKELVEAK
jgi:uncharacterized protein YndB with AHSA1/START domain